jgi:hypothetical protein
MDERLGIARSERPGFGAVEGKETDPDQIPPAVSKLRAVTVTIETISTRHGPNLAASLSD